MNKTQNILTDEAPIVKCDVRKLIGILAGLLLLAIAVSEKGPELEY